MEAKHAPATPQDFTREFPRYVYRDHKGREYFQWRKAAFDMYDDRANLSGRACTEPDRHAALQEQRCPPALALGRRMKTRRDARIWIYRDVVAFSLRKKAATLKARDIAPGVTPAGVKRAQGEMLNLADWLEVKAAKLAAKRA